MARAPCAVLIGAVLVIVFWIAVVSYAVLYDKLRFLSNTHWSLSAPKGSPADLAKHFFEDNFPQKLIRDPYPIVFLLSGKAGKSVNVLTDTRLPTWSQWLSSDIKTCDYDQSQHKPWCFARELESYYTLPNADEKEAW